MTAALDEAARMVAGGGVVVFTGAGMSEEAGIPTFRDPGGLWDRFEPSEFGTWQGLAGLATSRPDDLAEFLASLRRAFASAQPTEGHRALVQLEEAGLVEAVVTQNVDGLHQEAGSRGVLEIHGSFLRNRCLACSRAEAVSREEVCSGLDRAVVGLRQAFVPSFESLLPKCSSCGGPARPDFVAFGEMLRDFPQAEQLAAGCRVLLAVGTSGEVYPAASLPETAHSAGARVVVIASGPTSLTGDVVVEGKAGRVLRELAAAALRS
ncbi:MAG TPA: Sir2 family NAD-dependent protein deacetylase [Actinomycetota bacterium]|nr:Sir2 family NAD-dependent protein deacetylase [Actinomycetota bacterium]